MKIKLFIQAITKLFLGIILVGLLLFLPAGTICFTNGWLLIGILFVPMFLAGIVMMFKNPESLKKRLITKEKQQEQKMVVKLSGLMFFVGFIVAKRIKNEEEFLEKELAGYGNYKKEVKYRLVPFIW
ncbi:MAG: hypothetical protein IKW62_02150 [Clostridia bacterium]|nr:hypothetical protein [Clostridia bacterium]